MKLTAIILTKTSSQDVFDMTLQCAETLLHKGNPEIFSKIEITIIESSNTSTFEYPDWIQVIKPKEDFNFHKFLNYGIKHSPSSDWYILCNNDLSFSNNWLYEIELIIQNHPELGSISPISPTCKDQGDHLKQALKTNMILGYSRRREISGWCIMVSRLTLTCIGLLDERFAFYFADDDYALSLRRFNIKHALALRSHVYHLEDKKISLKQKPIESKDLVKIPRYLTKDRYRWILQSDDMLKGYLVFKGKWGSYPSVSLRKKIHDLLFLKLDIRFVSKLLFYPN